MNKWYRNKVVKAIWMGIAHVVSVVLIISLLWILACPSVIEDVVTGNSEGDFTETEGFTEMVWIDSINILNTLTRQEQFVTDGEIDRSKLVDIEEYHDTNTVTNANENGIAYTLDQLYEWAEAISTYDCESSHYEDSPQNPIIVCQKPDNSYEYYYLSELEAKVNSGEMKFIMSEEFVEEDIFNIMQEGSLYSGNGYLNAVLDSEGKIKYSDVWTYDGVWMEEMYVPEGAESLLDIVNADARWNGRLSEAFDMIYTTAFSVRETLSEYEESVDGWDEGNTNVSYIYADVTNKTLHTNRKAYEGFDNLEAALAKMREGGAYVIIRPRLADFETNLNDVNADAWLNEIKNYTDTKDFVYAVAVDTTFSIPDIYAVQSKAFQEYAPWIGTMLFLCGVSAVVLVIAVIWLTVVAGRRPEDEELHLHAWDKWKTEISAALVIGAWVFCIFILSNLWPSSYLPMDDYYAHYVSQYGFYDTWEMIIAGSVGLSTCAAFLIGYLSLVRRIKARTLWKDSLCLWLFRATKSTTKYIIVHVPTVWKTVLLFGGIVFLHWIALGSQHGFIVFLMLISEAGAFLYLLNKAIGRKKIREGIERIADGDVDFKISFKGLLGEQLEIAEMVNNIGEGLNAAVEKSMRSERLKTELITNVSHDIKTPLTSIINYIDLLKRENFTDPKVLGYLDILEAKAQRLKTLTEDVVEASKVSSGNVSLEYMNINLVEMIQQTSGEFEEKFRQRGLKEMLSLPDEPALIHVDGRRMWRVLENIYNNAAKYAMEGTRVYADLKVEGKIVRFSLKNISEQPLNINADELTERFIRGDVSRSTEGSGLGLSIAKNLTEMQGGKFELYLDGDLFKVTIEFPKC